MRQCWPGNTTPAFKPTLRRLPATRSDGADQQPEARLRPSPSVKVSGSPAAHRGCPCSVRDGSEPHGASAKHNAHKTEIHRVHYMWHPLFGCDVVVHFRAIRPTGVTFRCQVDQDDKRRRSEVPAWMFDRAVCSQIQLLPEPHVTLRALVELKWLLDSAARRQECQDRPPAELGGADESNPTKTPHVASTGSIRPTGPDTEVERPRTGRPSDGHKTGGIAVAGTLGTRGRPLPERGRR